MLWAVAMAAFFNLLGALSGTAVAKTIGKGIVDLDQFSVATGLEVMAAAGLAVIGAIVGEFVGGGGLGIVVLEAMRQQRTELVFAAVLYASFLGLALFGLVSGASRLALRRWHASEQG